MAVVAAVALWRRWSVVDGIGGTVRPGIGGLASSDHPRCRERATYVPGPGRCEVPDGKRHSSSEPGCGAKSWGVGSSLADRRWGGEKIFAA